MYSNKQNVLQLVALLKSHGISQVVLSPGSRNSPITHSLATDPFFTCHTVVDERSAGFYALGIIQATNQPTAVCVTSGTAVLNLAPAVAEACYQQLPLLAITADRPAAWIGQMDGQTIPQPGAFNTMVKKSVQLPEISTKEDEWYCNRLINEAILELDHHGKGPVQINIPLSEPLFEYTADSLPEVREIRRETTSQSIPECYKEAFAQYGRKMIIVGQMPLGNQAGSHLAQLADKHHCVVLAEHLANVDFPSLITNFDAMLFALPKEQWPDFAPDLLITIGGHIVSKRIKQFLRQCPPAAHWHVTPTGEVADLFQHVTDVIEADGERLAACLAQLEPNNLQDAKSYAADWNSYSGSLPDPETKFSDLQAVREFMKALPDGASLHVANSSSVRLAQLCPLAGKEVSVFCNRGTSGIEGSLSSAVGYAAASGKPTFLLIGDLSFFYDMNGLWNPQLPASLRILLNNNGGGEIFYALPGLNKSEALEDYISASHRTSAKAWAESLGFTYLSASNSEELQANMPVLADMEGDRPVMLEVFTAMEKNTDILRRYYHELKPN